MDKLMKETHSPEAVVVCKNYEILCDVLVKRILSLSREAIERRGRFTIALAGGLTPKGVYTRMAGPDYRNQFDWHNIHFFWGDERWVLPNHIKSNYRMAADSLLTRIDISVNQIHFIDTKVGDPETSALLYEKELKNYFQVGENQFPSFDLILLGLGQDGHIASVFPKSKALLEKKRWIVPVSGESHDEPRITMTFPVINQSRYIFFMVSGREKAPIVQNFFEGKDLSDWPVARVQPREGHVAWYLDQPAAALLQHQPAITIV